MYVGPGVTVCKRTHDSALPKRIEPSVVLHQDGSMGAVEWVQDADSERHRVHLRISGPTMNTMNTIYSWQLAQLVKALGSLPKGPGFKPDLAPTHITFPAVGNLK